MREAHNELLDAMMQSYRNLIRFARRNNLSVSASPQDIGVLTANCMPRLKRCRAKSLWLTRKFRPICQSQT
ncbi:Adenylate cyclase [Enterobacter cloacae]|uniref:Adenylate cyclase n=1 Tax=Enterobacter cloacae TaxID=550 RepID=A0A377LQX4_ENTCL|nr:Adenylate cyclase [Enterobacter cloacae]